MCSGQIHLTTALVYNCLTSPTSQKSPPPFSSPQQPLPSYLQSGDCWVLSRCDRSFILGLDLLQLLHYHQLLSPSLLRQRHLQPCVELRSTLVATLPRANVLTTVTSLFSDAETRRQIFSTIRRQKLQPESPPLSQLESPRSLPESLRLSANQVVVLCPST